MKFIITVDVEADNQWKRKKNIELKNIEYLPRFQSLCEKYNFVPTYLVAYEIATDEKAVKILQNWQEQGKAEIGAHLHPWTTPPYSSWEAEDPLQSTFPNELSDEELKNKIENLTVTISDKFGVMPVSFRAGRWGFDERIAGILEDLNYSVDCSITPKVNWKNKKGKLNGAGGPDFRSAQNSPYYLSKENILLEGECEMLEVPMSILYRGYIVKNQSKLATWFTGYKNNLIKRILNKFIFKLTWCRILPQTKLSHLIGLYKTAKRNKLPVLEFMIHSSELMPGGSPYNKSEDDIERLYEILDKFFMYLSRNKTVGVGLSEFARKYKK